VPDRIEAAQRGEDVLLRVQGRGAFPVAPAVKRFTTEAMAKGGRRFVFDMRTCEGMDSTFMGILAGLALRLQKEEGEVVLIHVSEKNRGLLHTLGLCAIVQMPAAHPASPVPREALAVLDTAADQLAAARAMLAAHESLVSASPDNLPKFQGVLSALKQDLERREKPPG
jgi:anti-anti-sigma factor